MLTEEQFNNIQVGDIYEYRNGETNYHYKILDVDKYDNANGIVLLEFIKNKSAIPYKRFQFKGDYWILIKKNKTKLNNKINFQFANEKT